MQRKIIPAILAEDLASFEQKIELAKKVSDHIQFDIADGDFVRGKTLEFLEIKSLPAGVFFEVHLMVGDPENYFGFCKDLAIKRVIFHHEIERDNVPVIEKIKSIGAEVFLALSPETDIKEFDQYRSLVDGVLVMAVEPGASGQELEIMTFEKVRMLRESFPDLLIEVDGGISQENIKEVFDSGADIVAVNSAFFKAEDPEKAWHELEEKIK